MHYKDVARIVHSVVREYNILHNIPGDNFTWYRMSPDYRISIEESVKREMENPAKSPAESHEKWLKARIDDDWVWGPHKSQEMKTHPCIVPYDELPPVQKFKDTIFSKMVALLKDAPPVEKRNG